MTFINTILAAALTINFCTLFGMQETQHIDTPLNLIRMIDHNEVNRLQQILKEKPELANSIIQSVQISVLAYACYHGSDESVRTLLKAGANSNGLGESNPPLLLTAMKEKITKMCLLLDHNADPNARNKGLYSLMEYLEDTTTLHTPSMRETMREIVEQHTSMQDN